MYSLIASCRPDGIDPRTDLCHVLTGTFFAKPVTLNWSRQCGCARQSDQTEK
jgi:hypothetical protein